MNYNAPYKASIAMEPIAYLDYYVRIRTYSEPNGFFKKVSYFEKIPFFQAIDLGAVAAGSSGVKSNVTNLDLWDDEFGQWRFFPLDNAQISLFIPSGVSKWQLKNLTVQIDKSIAERDPHLVSTEFCTWEDQRPSMQATNFSDYPLTACRIIVEGYRFHVQDVDSPTKTKLTNGQLPFTTIQCAGMAGGGM
jgi:hypothetical protein